MEHSSYALPRSLLELEGITCYRSIINITSKKWMLLYLWSNLILQKKLCYDFSTHLRKSLFNILFVCRVRLLPEKKGFRLYWSTVSAAFLIECIYLLSHIAPTIKCLLSIRLTDMQSVSIKYCVNYYILRTCATKSQSTMGMCLGFRNRSFATSHFL